MTAPVLLQARGQVATAAGPVAVDLELAVGEVVALVGPNGAGKSATLAALLGHLPLDGTVVGPHGTSLPAALHRRGLGWVPAAPALLPRRDVATQVRAFARDDVHPGIDAATRVMRLLTDLELTAIADRRPGQLSSGQTQRVMVARALASARTVLLDEVTAAQDVRTATLVRRAIRDHAAAGGAALVVVHQPDEALGLADRLVVLEGGDVVQTGTPAELTAHPTTPYVARVVGATVLRGVVRGGVLHSDDGAELVVGSSAPDGPATAVVRPGSVTLHLSDPGTAQSARNRVAGVVTGLDERGGSVAVVVDARPTVVAQLTLASVRRLGLVPGTPVWATWKASDVTLHPEL